MLFNIVITGTKIEQLAILQSIWPHHYRGDIGASHDKTQSVVLNNVYNFLPHCTSTPILFRGPLNRVSFENGVKLNKELII